MKTKYILHGGSAQKINADNDAYIQEILKDAPQDSKILLVYFAVSEDKYEINRIKDEANFERNKGDKKLWFDVADEHRFVDQVEWADVVYIGGGTTPDLMQVLEKFPELGKMFEDKTIAGESAGANVLAAWGYSPTLKKLFKGLGLVSVVMMPHYDESTDESTNTAPKKLERLKLREHEYKVFQE